MKKLLFRTGLLGCFFALVAWFVLDLNPSLFADIQPGEICLETGPDDVSLGVGCTKIKGSKCRKNISCKGFHEVGNLPCKIDPVTKLVTGECYHCDRDILGDLCQKTNVVGDVCNLADGWFDRTPKLNCGLETAAICRKDPNNPGMAKCDLDPAGAVGFNDCGSVTQCTP